jgi:hypothetical protein
VFGNIVAWRMEQEGTRGWVDGENCTMRTFTIFTHYIIVLKE